MTPSPTAATRAIDPRTAARAISYAMRGLEQRYEIAAANLANVDTSGHKRLVTRADSFDQALADAKSGSTGTVLRDFSQGDLVTTDNPRDLALSGPGFFAVEVNGQIEYTRSLTLRSDPEGTLLDQYGNRVLGDGGPLRTTPGLGDVQVEADGTVRTGDADVGRLQIVNFVDPQKLDDAGGDYWRASDKVEVTGAQSTQVRQGQRERSNVNALDEMVQLITLQRQYEAASKALSVESDLRKQLNQGLH
jgi:flagellar basal-body rod protein FlgF